VLPGKSLAFICTKPALRFTESELDAIREFQRDARIKVDGIVGPETRRKIRELLNCQ
jgi:peptidoglycan hydrolase-like protein with peptidoglycan-binding domain